MEGSITVTFQDGTQKELKASMVEAGGGGGGSSESTLKLYNDAAAKYQQATAVPSFRNFFSMTDEELAAILSDKDTFKTRENMSMIFNHCESITKIPDLDLSAATRLDDCFTWCSNLADLPTLSLPNCTTLSTCFRFCSKLTKINIVNSSKISNIYYAFFQCSNIEEIIFDDVSSITNTDSAFYLCSKLKRLLLPGIKVSIRIDYSTQFTREALLEILNNLGSVESTQTLTMGSTNLNKLTDDDKAIATNKGWTLA